VSTTSTRPTRTRSQEDPNPIMQQPETTFPEPEHAVTRPAGAPVSGTFVSISGMTARTHDGAIAGVDDVTAQAHQACRNLRDSVEATGATLADVIRLDVQVKDIRHGDAIHAVGREYFPTAPPASTLVEVAKMTNPEYLVELSAIAVVA
jgi:2-iminobutanoate/2-iminopropanoate deaminase